MISNRETWDEMPREIVNSTSYLLHLTITVGFLLDPPGLRNFFTFSNCCEGRVGEISFSLIFLLKITRAAFDIFCVNKGDAVPLHPHPAQIAPLLLKATRVWSRSHRFEEWRPLHQAFWVKWSRKATGEWMSKDGFATGTCRTSKGGGKDCTYLQPAAGCFGNEDATMDVAFSSFWLCFITNLFLMQSLLGWTSWCLLQQCIQYIAMFAGRVKPLVKSRVVKLDCFHIENNNNNNKKKTDPWLADRPELHTTC